MASKEPEAMAQIHKIRERLYQEAKVLTDEQILQRTRRSAKELKARHNLDVRKREAARKHR